MAETETGNVEEFIELINDLGVDFDKLCQERHAAGQKEYGSFAFLGNDVLRMMMEELADTSNYCRMQYIRLAILQGALENKLTESGLVTDGEQEITLGVQAFKGTKDVGWQKR